MRIKHKQLIDSFLDSRSHNYESTRQIKTLAHKALEAAQSADSAKARNDLRKQINRKKKTLIEVFNARRKALS